MVVFQEGQEEEDEEEEVEDEKPAEAAGSAPVVVVTGRSGAAGCSSGSSVNENDMDSDGPDEETGTWDKALTLNPPRFVKPQPHISTQFFTFNRESHSLMVRCIVNHRLAMPEEIRTATPQSVLGSWRGVWKDRNEGTAYLTGWKRIQEKLNAHINEQGNEFLYFKNNPQQYVSHVDQWQDIVMSFHGDADHKHLGLKETIERIKQVWTYASKRCGCGFRIRAIVPITNYNEKNKSFVYQKEGMAVFKLYAIHSGHEPGPMDGSARIIHTVVDMKDENMGFFGATAGGGDSDGSSS